MRTSPLKDNIRWIMRDDEMILQIKELIPHLDWRGQGYYDENWIDVSIVQHAEPYRARSE